MWSVSLTARAARGRRRFRPPRTPGRGGVRRFGGDLPPSAVGAAILLVVHGVAAPHGHAALQERPRARDVGVVIGTLPTGAENAITDVPGVRVGHSTVHVGDSIHTGLTAILPHAGNLFREKVRAAIVVGNGFGKLVGLSQVNELGLIETPILLTGTLSVFRAADALLDTLLTIPGNEEIQSINPVVGETNDGWLSDIRARPIRPEHVRAALRDARGGAVTEGTVGAGTGTMALGWKGGIGTASRRVLAGGEEVVVGVLVQTNFGGELVVDGVPVGRRLREAGPGAEPRDAAGGGSVMIVLATDAPLSHRGLSRLARRTFYGVARTGSSMSHGSGDYAIAFTVDRGLARSLDGRSMTRLFAAAMEATEEAILNSLFRATPVVGYHGHAAAALPIEEVTRLLRAAGK